MAAGTWQFTTTSLGRIINGTLVPGTDTFKVALFKSTSNLASSSMTYALLTNEVDGLYGYTTGGESITLTVSGTTTVTVDGGDTTWTASGGSITARYAVIYEVGGRILCYCLLDSAPADVTVTTGNMLTLAINASGIFTAT